MNIVLGIVRDFLFTTIFIIVPLSIGSAVYRKQGWLKASLLLAAIVVVIVFGGALLQENKILSRTDAMLVVVGLFVYVFVIVVGE